MDVTAEWHWEGNVVDRICQHLESTGWSVESKANTRTKARGIDIACRKENLRLFVEAKGYPSSYYRDVRRAGELKRTNPGVQAKHWYAEALLTAMRMRGKYEGVRIALGLPSFPRYMNLIEDTRLVLGALNVGIFLVHEDGRVKELEF